MPTLNFLSRSRGWIAPALLALSATPRVEADLMVIRGPDPGDVFHNRIQRYDEVSGTYRGDAYAMNEGWTGLCRGPDGNVYALTNILGHGTIHVFDPEGRQLGALDASAVTFPGKMIFGPDGHLYVHGNPTADWSSPARAIIRLNGATGAFLGVFAAPAGRINWIGSPCFGPDGHLYTATNAGIARYDGRTGAFIDVFVPMGRGGLTDPRALLFEANGDLLVSDAGTDCILRYAAAGGDFLGVAVESSAGGMDNPEDLTFGPEGNLYVASLGSDQILRFEARSGVFLGVFVSAPSLRQPRQLLFSSPPR